MLVETLAKLQELKLAENGAWARIDYALDSEPWKQLNSELPGCTFTPLSYESLGRLSDNSPNQLEDQIVAFYLVCAVEEFETRRAQFRDVIQGFEFSNQASGFEFTKGSVEGLSGGNIWFQQLAKTRAPTAN